MGILACGNQNQFCPGNTGIKLCGMCKNKAVSDHLDSLPVDQCVDIKLNMTMIDNITCKSTNASYYTSKQPRA